MSSRSLNRVMLIGNLTRDPELRYTPQGTPVCTFGMATNRSWQPSSGGERQEETEFHRIVSWNKLAELCAELLFKGRKVFIEGRLQTRNWTAADGAERTTIEVVIDNMIVLDSKRKDGASARPQTEYADIEYAAESSDQPLTDDTPEPVKEEKAKPGRPKKADEAAVASKKTSGEETQEVNPDDIPF